MGLDSSQLRQVTRFCMNGLIATGVHFFCLVWLIEHVVVASAGLANLLAGVAGVTSSFIGNRYFVFVALNESIASQLSKFAALYGIVLAVHGIGLGLWVDFLLWDYRIGFVVITALQIVLSYQGGRRLVFSEPLASNGKK